MRITASGCWLLSLHALEESPHPWETMFRENSPRAPPSTEKWVFYLTSLREAGPFRALVMGPEVWLARLLGRCSSWGWKPRGLLTQSAAPAFSGHHPPTPDLTPFFPAESNEELRLAVSCLQRVTGKCSGVFIKETTGDHIPREGLLKVLRFQDSKALFVSSWTTGGHTGVGGEPLWGEGGGTRSLDPRN